MGTTRYPEAELIRRARNARRMNIPDAAAAAGISQQRWGQIERSEGRQAPPETIAHMARGVGVTSDRLAEVRPEAAEILEEIELQEAAGTSDFERRVTAIVGRLPREERSVVEELLAEHLAARERNEQIIEKLIILMGHRGKPRPRGQNDATDDDRGDTSLG